MMKTIFSLFIKGMFVLLSVVAGSLYAAEPGGVASPKWWGQASGLAGADGSQISTWTNSSTTNVGQNAVQGTATARPLLRNNIAKRVNFNPVAQFDGSNDVLSVSAGFSGASTHQRAHYFMVVVPSNSTQQSWAFWETQVNFPVDADGRLAVHLPWLNTIYWDAGTCCANNRLSYTPSVPYVLTPTVWSFVKDTAPPSGMLKQEISRNAQVEATRASTTAFTGNNSAFNVGSGPGSGFFAGDIAEGLLYIDTIIDTTARLKVDSYLAIKYGITLGGPIGTATNYLSSTAATWWTGTAAYQFNIAGIAKDSTSALDQRISRSTNTAMAQISIAAGSSFPSGTITAQSPADSITNLDAFVWGDNNVSSTDSNSFFNIASGTQKGAQLSGRIWRAQRTGGSIGNVTLCIPDSLTPSTWQTPYLYAASDAGFTASVTITALGPSTAAVCPDVHGGSALVAGRRVTVNAANLAPSGGVGFFTIGQPVVSGTIFEDITGNLVAADGDANLSDTAGDQRRLQGVTVRLFYDINGNGNIGGGDPYIATATTNANGTYFLPTHLDTANYLVVVERPTTNAAGTTGLLAEQTYGSGNTIAVGTTKAIRALCETGAGATAQKTTNGACYGGRNGATADGNVGTTNAPNREHVTLVSVVSGNSVANVDSGFSFNVVTNLNDTGQGSLRQFIANANAIIGANAMRFVPAVPTNQTSGANTWWRITPTTALPAITVTNGNNTTIDGRAYNLADGVTQLQTNTASIGSTLSVGTGVDARVGTGDEYAMSSLNGPELEVNWATPASSFILQAQAASTTIQNVCLNNPTANANTAIIQVTNAASNSIIQNNVLGSSCGNNTLDGTGSPTNASNSGIVAFENSTGVTISGNKIGNRALGLAQLTTAGAANNATIRGNEVYNDTGASSGINLGVGTNNLGLAGASVIRDNYLWGIAGRGFVDDANSIYSFLNNTVLRGARVGATIATTQLRVLQNNIFYNNTDAGTQGQGVVVGGSGVAVATNSVQITQNSFLNNQGNAIDLGGGGVNVPTSSCAGGG